VGFGAGLPSGAVGRAGKSDNEIAQDDAGPAPQPMLVLDHVTKSFGAVRALSDGSLKLYAGEAHGLVGENGAGKSTLVKILAGVHRPDSGLFTLDGKELSLHGPAAAAAAGIAVIYQEPTLFPDLSVAENIFIGRQPVRSWKRINWAGMNEAVKGVLDRLGVRMNVTTLARGLSVADQQIVEIAKALSFNARVIVMDEPTAALSNAEVDRLFEVISALRAQGAAVLFISHRLADVFSTCQRVTVMRDGRFVMSDAIGNLTVDAIIRAMIGRDLSSLFPKTVDDPGAEVLRVEHLTREGVFTDVSFNVRAGEIVALAGLMGAGRSEVARAIFGIDGRDAGRVVLNGKTIPAGSPTVSMAAGMGFVPEDRRQQGLVMDLAIDHNVALASLGRLTQGTIIRRSAETALAADWATRLRLKYGRLKDPANTLSGGNQQKVVLAKWLARQPSLLIIDEPTRGIDVGTKAEVHRLLDEIAHQGVAVLMISSELPEVLGMADRVLVLREGRIAAEFARHEADEASIMRAATGQLLQNSAVDQ
jgi:rhamnose transport system ATP-binding protein